MTRTRRHADALASLEPRGRATDTGTSRVGSPIISWGTIVFGAVLSVLAAAVLLVAVGERPPAVLAPALVLTALGPIAWNAVLRATHASQFFTDAPVAVFPASWQDVGSGVFTLAGVGLVLAAGPLRGEPAGRVAKIAALCALAAFAVDIYLY